MTQHDESQPDTANTQASGPADPPPLRSGDGASATPGEGAPGAPPQPSGGQQEASSGQMANGTAHSMAESEYPSADARTGQAEDPEQSDSDGDIGLAELNSQIESLQAALAAQQDQMLRLQADTENQRKRAQKDISNARKFALEGVVNDLLPVKDSLEMGIQAAQAAAEGVEHDLNKLIEGSDLTLKMLSQVFEKHNIAEIDPAGEKFNPEFHQAMSMQEVDGVAANTVTSVLQKGYTLNERLVRPALVMVAK